MALTPFENLINKNLGTTYTGPKIQPLILDPTKDYGISFNSAITQAPTTGNLGFQGGYFGTSTPSLVTGQQPTFNPGLSGVQKNVSANLSLPRGTQTGAVVPPQTPQIPNSPVLPQTNSVVYDPNAGLQELQNQAAQNNAYYQALSNMSNQLASNGMNLRQSTAGDILSGGQSQSSQLIQKALEALTGGTEAKRIAELQQQIGGLQGAQQSALAQVELTPGLTSFQAARRNQAITQAAGKTIEPLTAELEALTGLKKSKTEDATTLLNLAKLTQENIVGSPITDDKGNVTVLSQDPLTGAISKRSLGNIGETNTKNLTGDLGLYQVAIGQGFRGSILDFLKAKDAAQSSSGNSILDQLRLIQLQQQLVSSPGQLINAATGLPLQNVPANLQSDITGLLNFKDVLLPTVRSQLEKTTTGGLSGRYYDFAATLPGFQQTLPQNVNDLYATINDLSNSLIYLKSGKQINESEYERLLKQLPQLTLTREQNTARINLFDKELTNIINTKLGLFGGAVSGRPDLGGANTAAAGAGKDPLGIL